MRTTFCAVALGATLLPAGSWRVAAQDALFTSERDCTADVLSLRLRRRGGRRCGRGRSGLWSGDLRRRQLRAGHGRVRTTGYAVLLRVDGSTSTAWTADSMSAA
jgi:hypothetical protein